MSNIPLPPPLPLMTLLKNTNLIDENNNKSDKFECNECKWAVKDKDVQKSCYFAKVCLFASPIECVYMKFTPILQIGPTCGLNALSMLCNGTPTAEQLLQKAIQLKYSINGEMFSAQWLLDLLKDNLENSSMKMSVKMISAYIYNGNLDSEFIKVKLINHCVLLVPYDADVRNHSPTLLNGHKSHWALIVGYLIDDLGEFHVFARHGKTKNLGLFKLKDLSKSNSNLDEFSQPTQHANSIFLLPENGINGEKGLKNKSIVIEGMKNEVVKVV